MKKIRWYKVATLAVLVLALLIGLSSCNLFKSSLTIYNYSSFDLDFVQWTDSNGNSNSFGDDLVWDSILVAWESGIASGSSSTRQVSKGSDYIYFYFTNDSVHYRTTAVVSVGAMHDASFTFWDSTIITTAQLSGSGSTSPGASGIVPVPGSKLTE